jgi:hypothetical protein
MREDDGDAHFENAAVRKKCLSDSKVEEANSGRVGKNGK